MQRVFATVTWQPLLTVFIALTLAGLSLFYTKNHLGFLTSQRSLISSENRLIQLSKQLDQFDDLDNFVIAIENQDKSRSLGFLRALVARLEADPTHYIDVFYRIDPKVLRPWALLYLSRKDLLNVKNNLEEHPGFIKNLAQSPNVVEFFRLANAEIASGVVEELFTGFLSDKPSGQRGEPVDLTLLINSLKSMKDYLGGNGFSSPWATFFSGESWDEDSEGYFWTENKRYLILFVTPAKADKGFGKAQGSLKTLRQTIAKVQTDIPDVKAGVTGQEALNVDEMMLALEDMSLATIISLVGLTILLVVFWKGSRRPWFGISELLVALCLTFGLTTLVVGHLNILSVVFAPLVLGLGIDYGTHWLSRYQEEVQKAGISRKEAIRTTMVNLGPGLVTAGLSAALSFFPLVLTGFRGLAELGVICSMGMLMTTSTSMCVLPAITLLFDKGPTRKVSSGYCPTNPLFRLTTRLSLTILIASSLGLVLSLVLAKGVTFDLNMLRLQSKSAESVIWEMKILKESKRSSMYGALLAHSPEEVERKAKALESLPSVSEVQSVASLVPQNQQEKMSLVRQLAPLLPELENFHDSEESVNLEDLKNTLSKISFKMLDPSWSESGDRSHLEQQMAQVRELIEDIRQHFESTGRAESTSAMQAFNSALMRDLQDKLDIFHSNAKRTRPMVLDDLPEKLLKRFVGENQTYLIRVFPAQDIWEPEILGRFVQELRTVDPDVVGDPVTLYTFTKEFRDACMAAVIYALILITALLLFTFRSIVYALLAMVPLFVGTAWTLGLIRCFGINLNLANSVFLPMIVGAGVEYAIIILQRWVQGGNGSNVLPFSTGKGVILAGLSTTIGFGSLMISSHQGVYSLGLLTTVGSLCVLAAAILLLPAIMHLLPAISTKWAPREITVSFPRAAEECVSYEKERT
jgi:hopanoid biosynthesis associated RND transporter like protein HpnN